MLSYRDKLISFNGCYMPKSEEDEIWNDQDSKEEDNLIVEEDILEESYDPTCPIVKVSKEERCELYKPWKMAFTMKLLSKRLGDETPKVKGTKRNV